MSVFEGFVGPSYRSLSKYAAIERSVNWFPEVIETKEEHKNHTVLYPTPCTGYLSGPATQYPGTSRALLELNGRLFGVNGPYLFEFTAPTGGFPSGAWLTWGTVTNDNKPVSMVANGVTTTAQQIFISSGDKGFVYSLGGVFTDLSTVPGFLAGRGAAFLDSYFISIIPGTNQIQVCSINDGTQWDASDIQPTADQSDTLVNLIADRDYLWLFGGRRTEIWYNQGGQFFPFALQPGAFLEIGLGAAAALVQADNTLFWMGQDKRGGLSAWRANGFSPLRVSNHAVEQAWASYSTTSDCIAYSFLWRGHTFIRFIFPTAEAGWTYDCAASQQLGLPVWHENSFTDANGEFHAPIERTHAYFNNTHVVGSGGAEGSPGTLYQFTDTTVIDTDPQLLLRYSNDGGNVFWNERTIAVGQGGAYGTRAISNLLGAGRDRVFWVRAIDFGDAVPNIDGTGGFAITRDRICPHLYNEDKRIFYRRLEVELQKGIGALAGQPPQIWALINAYLTFEAGQN